MRSQGKPLSASRPYSFRGVDPPERTKVALPRSSLAVLSRCTLICSAVAATLSVVIIFGGIPHIKPMAYWMHEPEGQGFGADGRVDAVGEPAQAHAVGRVRGGGLRTQGGGGRGPVGGHRAAARFRLRTQPAGGNGRPPGSRSEVPAGERLARGTVPRHPGPCGGGTGCEARYGTGAHAVCL